MHTKTQSLLLQSMVAALLLILILPFQAWAQAAGEVARVQGAATATRAGAGADAALPLAVGDAVYSGDELETGADARLELAMADGTVLTLGGGTRLALDGYVWMEEAGTGLGLLRLGKGAFRAVTGALTQVARPRFEVATPLAAIGIRGTDFWGGFLDADALDVLFVAGNKRIEITNALGTTYLEAPGQGLTVQPGAAPGPMKVWGDAKRKRAFDTVTFAD